MTSEGVGKMFEGDSEDDLKKNGRRPHKNENGRQPQFFEDGRQPHFYLNGRRP
jgi:hypothetical protein